MLIKIIRIFCFKLAWFFNETISLKICITEICFVEITATWWGSSKLSGGNDSLFMHTELIGDVLIFFGIPKMTNIVSLWSHLMILIKKIEEICFRRTFWRGQIFFTLLNY